MGALALSSCSAEFFCQQPRPDFKGKSKWRCASSASSISCTSNLFHSCKNLTGKWVPQAHTDCMKAEGVALRIGMSPVRLQHRRCLAYLHKSPFCGTLISSKPRPLHKLGLAIAKQDLKPSSLDIGPGCATLARSGPARGSSLNALRAVHPHMQRKHRQEIQEGVDRDLVLHAVTHQCLSAALILKFISSLADDAGICKHQLQAALWADVVKPAIRMQALQKLHPDLTGPYPA
eukprot:3372722-Amphidinium_carterae.1